MGKEPFSIAASSTSRSFTSILIEGGPTCAADASCGSTPAGKSPKSWKSRGWLKNTGPATRGFVCALTMGTDRARRAGVSDFASTAPIIKESYYQFSSGEIESFNPPSPIITARRVFATFLRICFRGPLRTCSSQKLSLRSTPFCNSNNLCRQASGYRIVFFIDSKTDDARLSSSDGFLHRIMSTYRQISERRLTKKVELAQSQAHVYFAGMSYFLVLVAIVPELAPFNIYVC